MTCPVCHSDSSIETGIEIGSFNLMECRECQHGWLTPVPDADEIASLYSSSYFDAWGIEKGEPDDLVSMKQASFRSFLNQLPVDQYSNILEVGCATGILLQYLSAVNPSANLTGVELSAFASSLALKNNPGATIHNLPLEAVEFNGSTFDLLIMIDLIEHVICPNDFVKTLSKISNRGAKVLVVTPHFDSFTRHVFGNRWLHFKPEHLHYFSEKSMATVFHRNGFEMIRKKRAVKHFNLSYVQHQFEAYDYPFKWVFKLIPGFLKRVNFPMYIGEKLYIFERH